MELVYGAERSSNPDRNLTSLEGFVARMDVLPLDDSAAAHAACTFAGIGVGDQQ